MGNGCCHGHVSTGHVSQHSWRLKQEDLESEAHLSCRARPRLKNPPNNTRRAWAPLSIYAVEAELNSGTSSRGTDSSSHVSHLPASWAEWS